MGIYRSNDPTTWDDVDQIVIDERAPTPAVQGVASNIAGYLARFQRGPEELVEVGSTQQFEEIFGRSNATGNKNLKNKRFGRLRIRRVVADDAAKASLAIEDSSSATVMTIQAKHKGAYGNSLSVTIAAGTSSGTSKITIKDGNTDAVLPDEVYDDILIASKTQEELDVLFADSQLIDVVAESPLASTEPDTLTETNLATGSDGAEADADYEDPLTDFAPEKSANFLFADKYSDDINGYLEAHASATQDKMVILAGAEGDDVSTAITDVADYRDADGRMIYAYPYIQTRIDGVLVFQNPASWMASILSQTAPNIDPAYVANTQFLGGITKLKKSLSRSDYIQLKEAGISGFEFDPDIGFKVKSGVTTQILNSSKTQILRRRMADYLTNSGAFFLKNFQNAVNNRDNRLACGAALLQFVSLREQEGILPKDDEVQGGKAKVIDVETLNTDESIAQGYFKILWRQRIYSSMRFIVLSAEIGQSVVVSEEE